MILLITYDTVDKTKDLSELETAVKQTGTWWHHISNVWMVQTDEDPNVWSERIKSLLGPSANVLVIRVSKNYQGWLPKTAWDWLDQVDYD